MNYLPFVAAGWSYAKTTQNKLINRWVSYGLMSVLSGAAAVETGTIREYFTRATIPDFRMRGIITIYAKTMTSTARKELMTRFTATSISPRRYTEPPIFKRTIKKEFKSAQYHHHVCKNN